MTGLCVLQSTLGSAAYLYAGSITPQNFLGFVHSLASSSSSGYFEIGSGEETDDDRIATDSNAVGRSVSARVHARGLRIRATNLQSFEKEARTLNQHALATRHAPEFLKLGNNSL
jgi:hypothetical protein